MQTEPCYTQDEIEYLLRCAGRPPTTIERQDIWYALQLTNLHPEDERTLATFVHHLQVPELRAVLAPFLTEARMPGWLGAWRGWRLVRWGLTHLGWALLILVWSHLIVLWEYAWFMDQPLLCRLAATLALIMVALSLAFGWPPLRYATVEAATTWLSQRVQRLWARVRP